MDERVKEWVWKSASFGAAFGSTLALIAGLVYLYQAWPHSWNRTDYTASFFRARVYEATPERPSHSRLLYDLKNNTSRDFEPGSYVLLVRQDSNVLIELTAGKYHVAAGTIVPAHSTARLAVTVNNLTKPMDHAGFVLLDRANHVEIDLPRVTSVSAEE